MKHAETVIFGGSSLNRAADLRANPDALTKFATAAESCAIILWRGKPLFCGPQQETLVRLPISSPILSESITPPMFLGLEDDKACFAYDISDWQPEDLDAESLGKLFDPSSQYHPSLPTDHLFCELRSVMSTLTARDAELAATAKALFGWHRTHQFCAVCGKKSQMAMGGWQRDCPSCNASHFPRTDPVVIMLITSGNKVLIGRSPGWPEGMYSLLAGFVEPGETLEAAVRREVFEEAGVQVGRVDYLASQPWPFPSSLMAGCRGEATSEEITIDPLEIEDALWVTREDMMQIFAGDHPLINPARKGAIAHFILRNWLADRLD